MSKGLKIFISILGILILMALIFFSVDYSRVKKKEKPIFCLNIATYKDGGTKEYYGLGYKVIDFNRLDGYDEIKIGTWFMKYSDMENEYENFEKSKNLEGQNGLKNDKNLKDDNNSTIMKAIVVKVNEKNMTVMEVDDENSLVNVGFMKEGNIGFKQGQEILIYYDGTVMTTYPAQISNVEKIEIVKEKSDIEIPVDILKYCYNSRDNVNVTVNELTKNGIIISVVDKNELPYDYSDNYCIYKKIKNEEYTGVGTKIGEDTKYSTSGYTRNRK